jgi:predicted nucleic acid-binding protein
LNDRDQAHARTLAQLSQEPRPHIIPAAILGEVTYMIDQRARAGGLDDFLADVEAGAFELDCGEDDFPRIRALVRRYADMPLGFADAAVIACAERSGGRVLTLDLRRFGPIARELPLRLLPD